MRKATDPEIVSAVREAFVDGEVDVVTGAVHPSTVAERTELSTSNAYWRCRQVAEKGLLEPVSGVDLRTRQTKIGYLCLEHAPPKQREI